MDWSCEIVDNMDYKHAIKKISSYIKTLNSNTCAFTGHRYQKLPWGNKEKDPRCKKMKQQLKKEIIKAIESGYKNFICGMALGFDTIVAEMIIELKNSYPNIKLIGAIPCKQQDKYWCKKDKLKYKKLLTQLDSIRCLYDEYIGPECMLERNRYMINNSSLLIALYDGLGGGTQKNNQLRKKTRCEGCIAFIKNI